MFRCRAFNFFDFYAIQTLDVLKRRRLKLMSGWHILKIVSPGGLCPWVAATLGLEYLSRKWPPYLITAFAYFFKWQNANCQPWRFYIVRGSHAGLSCDLEFLSKTLTSHLMTWQIMRRDTWKKMETNGNSPSFPIISGVQCFSCVDPLVCH